MKCVVIGGGAAGMFCAGLLAQEGHDVTLIEKNEKLGKKIYITGKGRCNVTNDSQWPGILDNVVNNSRFVMSAISRWMPQDMMEFLEGQGVPLKVERGNRVFPKSDKSSDIIKALSNFLYDNGVNVLLNTKCTGLIIENKEIKGVKTSKGDMYADIVVVATGGLSYPTTGSTGDGYIWAKDSGHTIIEPRPGLNALIVKGTEKLAGLTLKNVEAKICSLDQELYSEFGEMLFTHTGVSGPIILTLESKINKFYLNKKFNRPITLYIDLKPAISEDELDNRLLKDFKAKSNLDIKNLLPEYMPKSLIDLILAQAKISSSTKCNSITKEERSALIGAIKGLKFNVVDIDKIEAAIITAGGVDVKDINPKSYESKIIKHLYFIGEVLDIDALTGGFNLQLAFSTAHAMAKGI